jgi:hypothetical protein
MVGLLTRWVRRMVRDGRDTPEMIRARLDHLTVLRKAERELPDDEMIRAAVRAAERAIVESRRG